MSQKIGRITATDWQCVAPRSYFESLPPRRIYDSTSGPTTRGYAKVSLSKTLGSGLSALIRTTECPSLPYAHGRTG